MAAEVSLRAEGCRLVLRIDRYAYPAVTSGSDANWLAGEVELTAGATGAYRAAHRVALRTDELAEFRDQLRQLERRRPARRTSSTSRSRSASPCA